MTISYFTFFSLSFARHFRCSDKKKWIIIYLKILLFCMLIYDNYSHIWCSMQSAIENEIYWYELFMNEIERYWLTSRKIMIFGEHISGLIFLKCWKVASLFWTNFTNEVITLILMMIFKFLLWLLPWPFLVLLDIVFSNTMLARLMH